MLILLLQIWGGSFYLLNKLCFSQAERAENIQRTQKWRVRAWITYIAGLPAWVYIFIVERNWIAAAVESSGSPAMIMGLIAAWQGHNRVHEIVWLDHLARLMIVIGLGMSFYDFGGLVTFNQCLEIGIAAGFLFGTYFMAKSIPEGYLWLAVGNICAAWLMLRHGYYLLGGQQMISLGLVLDAYRVQYRKVKEEKC